MLDLCCGPGRHARPLSEAGYRVIGLDRDAPALGDASVVAPKAVFVRGDMRQLPLDAGSLDAAICMWQSFGQLDDAGNEGVLAELARVLAPNGSLVLDLYHRDATREGTRVIERAGEHVHESRIVRGDRLLVHLRYESSSEEESFEWELFTPATLGIVAARVGFELMLACAEFDETVSASAEHARMQVVMRRGPRCQVLGASGSDLHQAPRGL